MLKNKVDNKTNEINNFKASCSSLAEQISDDKLIETKVEQLSFWSYELYILNDIIQSIEDLTNSLALFGDGKIKVNQTILGELDQLIGDFLELSGKQYIVTSTLTVKNHAVSIEENESLEPVNRSTFEPVFVTVPEPTEFGGEGALILSATVCGIPRPHVRWYKSKMSLNKDTRMVDVLGDYCIVADNLHGSAQTVANVKYKLNRVTSLYDNGDDSSSYYTGKRGAFLQS